MDERPPITRPIKMSLDGGPASTNGDRPKEREPRPGEPEFDTLPQSEQIRRSILASFLAVEHSLEALEIVRIQSRTISDQSTALRDLTATVGPLVLRVDALITDLRDEKQKRFEKEQAGFDSRQREDLAPTAESAVRPSLHSYSDLPSEKTEGGTQRFFATKEQLREIARVEFKEMEKQEALERDARPRRWVRETFGPQVFFLFIGGVLAAFGEWIWKILTTKH